MRAIIAGIAPSIAVTIVTATAKALARRAVFERTSTQNTENICATKRGAKWLPFYFCCVVLEARDFCRRFRERLAPRERCAQLWFSSEPGGFMILSGASELSSPFYSGVLPGAIGSVGAVEIGASVNGPSPFSRKCMQTKDFKSLVLIQIQICMILQGLASLWSGTLSGRYCEDFGTFRLLVAKRPTTHSRHGVGNLVFSRSAAFRRSYFVTDNPWSRAAYAQANLAQVREQVVGRARNYDNFWSEAGRS